MTQVKDFRTIVWFNNRDPVPVGSAQCILPNWKAYGEGRAITERKAAEMALEDLQAKGWSMEEFPWWFDHFRTKDLRPRVFNVRLYVK